MLQVSCYNERQVFIISFMLEYHLNAYDNILRCCNLMYNIVIRIKSMWSTLRHIRTYHNYICIDCPDNCSISKNKRIMKCHIVFWCYVLSFKIMYLTIQILINIRVNSTDFHVYFLAETDQDTDSDTNFI